MSNDVKEIEFALMVSLEALYFQPLNILLFLIALVMLSAKLTLYILLFLPITALIIGLIGRSLRKRSTRNQELLGKVMTAYDEAGFRQVLADYECIHRLLSAPDVREALVALGPPAEGP
jgi:subfamily B ATP-binding cassette protein MsbA